MRWPYKGRILISTEQLGKRATDLAIIKFCQANDLVWVTKDWSTGTVDAHVKELRAAGGVSVWWLREENRKQMKRPQLLWVAARDIEVVAFAAETEAPIYVWSSVGSRPRKIELPFAKRRATVALRPPRPAKPVPSAMVRLFPE